MATVKVLSASHCHCFALSADTLVYFWHGEVSLESVRLTRDAVGLAREQHPEGVYVLALITQGTKMPSGDVRTESAFVDRACGGFIRAHATVIPGEGFWVASARSVLGAVFFLSRTSYPRRVFGDPRPALAWLRSAGGAQVQDLLLGHILAQQASVMRG